MFNKKKPQPGIQQTKLATLIAEDVRITGDLEFADGLRLDGQVSGNVSGKTGVQTLLVLSERSAVHGNVHGYDIVVNGRIVGDVIADHFIELQANAQVIGNIDYQQLQMDCGASVDGKLTRRDPADTRNLLLDAPVLDVEVHDEPRR
ncbi:polymer-forming cytoskeletal protein [Paraburkholderia sp. Ac-20347]|uniref:bactofilin family protein n=1 Tax=Paraburkholderia sp. Ac-20347 TaxID=2703892 RepID=UPI001980D9FE|nr:polymer-forming cytoskeletal protein [Paraburkholderia sp. Ac-20347]MBN3814538.1 polymer-forming cytoskeletal protein [Paraburkholderia sp. Ac-20347]